MLLIDKHKLKQKCNNFGYLSIQVWLKGNDNCASGTASSPLREIFPDGGGGANIHSMSCSTIYAACKISKEVLQLWRINYVSKDTVDCSCNSSPLVMIINSCNSDHLDFTRKTYYSCNSKLLSRSLLVNPNKI